MKKHIVILIAAGALLSSFCGCGKKGSDVSPAGQERARQVRTAVVQEEAISFPVRCCGRLCYRTEVALSFRTGGVVQEAAVAKGQRVQRGDILAKLESAEIGEEARRAELTLEKAARDFKRLEKLYKGSATTGEKYENGRTAWQQAEAGLKIARANLEHRTIRAAGAGTILEKLVEAGEVVAPGAPVLVFAAAGENWDVKVGVADKDIVNLRVGDPATATFDAYPGTVFAARVSALAASIDEQTGTCEVELELEETAKRLVRGLIAKVTIRPSRQEQYLVVPIEALVEGTEDKGYVYRYENGKPEKREIRIFGVLDEKLIIAAGLKAGDEVMVEGQVPSR